MMTRQQACARFAGFTSADRRDGFFEAVGSRLPMSVVFASFDAPDEATLVVIEDGLRGWPGDCFVRIEIGDGFGCCGFADAR